MDNIIDASPLTYFHANFEVLHQRTLNSDDIKRPKFLKKVFEN